MGKSSSQAKLPTTRDQHIYKIPEHPPVWANAAVQASQAEWFEPKLSYSKTGRSFFTQPLKWFRSLDGSLPRTGYRTWYFLFAKII